MNAPVAVSKLKIATGAETRAECAQRMVAAARRLAPEFRKAALRTEAERRISPEITAAYRNAGIARLLQPRRFGGYELRFSDFLRVSIELGSGDGSAAWGASFAILFNWLVGLYPMEAQEEVWSDPDALVTGCNAPTGTCAPAEGGYRLSGEWSFVSNCDNSQWFVVAASLPRVEAGPPVIGYFLIPRDQTIIKDTWFSMGMSGTGSKSIVVEEPVFVPAHRLLTVPAINSGHAPGAEINGNPLYTLTFSGTAPFTLCGVSVGIARGALEQFIEIAATKMATQPGGPPARMATMPGVHLAIGEASAIIDSVTLLLERDVAEIDTLHDAGQELSVEARVRHRRDQGFAGREAARATGLLLEHMGANGGAMSSPIQRAWRDTNLIARHISLSWPFAGGMFGQVSLGQPPSGTY